MDSLFPEYDSPTKPFAAPPVPLFALPEGPVAAKVVDYGQAVEPVRETRPTALFEQALTLPAEDAEVLAFGFGLADGQL